MSYETVNIGSAPNAKDGDTARAAFRKVNNNFAKIFEVLSPIEFTSVSASLILEDKSQSILANTSAGIFNLALPQEPTVGTQIVIYDERGTFGLNSVTVLMNGQRLNGVVAANKVLNIPFSKTTFVYISAQAGWIVS